MFTMSMQQFIEFASDCHALVPSTSVSVGEVHRIFSRMRRQHAWELASSLKRAMNGSADEVTSDANSVRREEDTRAVAVAATVQEDDGRGLLHQIYDSGRAITYREFVEGVVRLANAIGAQQGERGRGTTASRVPSAPTPLRSSPTSPLDCIIPGGTSPRPAVSPRATADTRMLESQADDGGSLSGRNTPLCGT
ncbi:unnamed protein product [Sphacelaria rigidula]